MTAAEETFARSQYYTLVLPWTREHHDCGGFVSAHSAAARSGRGDHRSGLGGSVGMGSLHCLSARPLAMDTSLAEP